MGLDGLSLARRFANSDRPTGPTLAACGEAIARKVAFTAPFNAAVVEFDTPTAPTAAPDASIE